MVANKELEGLLAALDKTVEDGLRYFQGPGATSKAKIANWGPREVLCHNIYWHTVTAEGIEAVVRGGKPSQIRGDTDEVNAKAVSSRAGQSLSQLASEARKVQQRLVKGVRALPDPNTTVMIRANGEKVSAKQRMTIIAEHWQEHLAELQAAAKP